jgi:SAM-dependent methyltransferase
MERSGFVAPKEARLPEVSTGEVPGWVSVVKNGGDANPQSTASEIIESISAEEFSHLADERRDSIPSTVESEILNFGRARSIRTHYWTRTYEEDEGLTEPSSFALWLVQRLEDSGLKSCLDFGCGNGRDAAHLSKIVNVVGVDAAESAVTLAKRLWGPLSASHTLSFVRGTDEDLNSLLMQYDIDFFYSRFVWHSLTPSQEIVVSSALQESLRTGGIVALEARTTQDPMASRGTKISKNERALGHYRRFVEVDELLSQMEDAGFLIKEIMQGRGLAALGDDDPHVVRLIAQKR